MRRLALAALLAASCAARGPLPEAVAGVARADALVREGCYRCLEEALRLYERAATGARAPHSAAHGAFEAALLLAIRSKELGLPGDGPMQRARGAAGRLTAAQRPAVDLQLLLAAAELIVGDLSGLDPEERERQTVQAKRGEAFQNPDGLAAAYVALSIDCERGTRPDAARTNELLTRYTGAPLIRYRLATCGVAAAGPLAALRADPRWVETFFFEGRRETQSSAGDAAKAATMLTAAREAFPGSHAIVLALARAQRDVGEYEAALASVDSVLADVPAHRDALLARLENLSYLNRHHEAVDTASRMIALGTWHVGQAFYWRAWNRLYLRELEAAWSDVERAATLQSNTSVYLLAGFIAHARKELDTAIDRFDRAFAIDNNSCLAAFSAGMVHVEQERWPLASEKFSRSAGCYGADAAAARAEIARTEASTYGPEQKTRVIAAQQKRAASSEHLSAQSAFNAAQSYFRLGQRQAALTHADAAAAHALMREKAVALKAAIEKMR